MIPNLPIVSVDDVQQGQKNTEASYIERLRVGDFELFGFLTFRHGPTGLHPGPSRANRLLYGRRANIIRMQTGFAEEPGHLQGLGVKPSISESSRITNGQTLMYPYIYSHLR